MRGAGVPVVRQLAARRPRTALRLAQPVAVTTATLRRESARTWENFLKGAVLDAVRQLRGAYYDPPIVPSVELARLRSPIVLVSLHVGAFEALGAAVESVPGEFVAFHGRERPARAGMTLLEAGSSESDRVRAFARALAHMRRGASTLVLADSVQPGIPAIEVPMLGRTLALARGPFALARMARAPVVPVAARWRGTAVEVEVGGSVGPDGGEEAMARAVGSWFDGYVSARPGELSVFTRWRLRPPLQGR